MHVPVGPGAAFAGVCLPFCVSVPDDPCAAQVPPLIGLGIFRGFA
jgi:hypothetical protein